MRILILLLAFPFTATWAQAPDCTRLNTIAQQLEDQILKKNLKDCTQLNAADYGLSDSKAFDDYKCKDFSAIEMQLKSVESEIALLNGIAALKNEIVESKNILAQFPNPNLALEASQSFYQNVKIAADMELFLNTNNAKGENLLSVLSRADESVLINQVKFAQLIADTCPSFGAADGTICGKQFVLTENTMNEIKGMIDLSKKTDRRFNKSQVKDLKNALKFKSSKDVSSYNALLTQIKDPKDGVISKEEMAKLKDMGDFVNDDDFSFLKNLKKSMADLGRSVYLVKAQQTPSRFSGFLSDLKRREEWQMKSKLSFILAQYPPPASAKEACESAMQLNGDYKSCLKPYIDEHKDTSGAIVSDMLEELNYGESHKKDLDKLLKECVPSPDTLDYPAACENAVSGQLADLVEKAQALNVLKKKQFETMPNLLTARDFAREKLSAGECLKQEETNINGCSQDLGLISREAVALTANTGEIILVLEKGAAPTKLDEMCKSGTDNTPFIKELCLVKDEEVEKKEKWSNSDAFDVPLEPSIKRDPTSEGLKDASNNLISGLANMINANQMRRNMMSPYPSTIPMAPIAVMPYPASGTGVYTPTPGLRPYSSINSNVGTASGYDLGNSTYFDSPVGW